MNSNFKKQIPVDPNEARIQRLIDSGNRSDFALSLVKQFKTKGRLSDKQWAFVDKLANIKADGAAFREANPDVVNWLRANSAGNSFAGSLWDQLLERGSLSEKQVAAVRRNLVKSEREGSSNVVVANVAGVIAKLKADGINKIAITIGGYRIYTPESRDDVLYVKVSGQYIGKLTLDGKYIPAGASQRVDAENLDRISKLEDSELAAQFIAEGRKTGKCGICSRTLTNAESIAAGIGPICAGRVGF